MRYSIIASAVALTTTVFAVPHARDHIHANLHKRQQMVTKVVTVTARPEVTDRPEFQDLAADQGNQGGGGFITLPDGDVLPKDGPFTPRVTATGAEVITKANGQKSVSHLEQTLGLSTNAQQDPGPTGAAQPASYGNIPPNVAAYFESDPSGGPPTHDFEVIPNMPKPQPGPNQRDYPGTILLQHNFHRKNHSASEVIWGFALQRTAMDHANKCVFEHDLSAEGGGYGQSMVAGIPANTIGKVITDTFYNPQVSAFDGLYGQASPDTSGIANWGFFTQMVWKSTQQVGCYTVDCSSKGGLKGAPEGSSDGFTVCNYWPAGNVDGQYAENVGQSQNWPSMQWDTDSWPPPGS